MRDKTKRERLEAEGWKIGTVAEFLTLTTEESAMVEIESAPEGTVRKTDEASAIVGKKFTLATDCQCTN